MKIKMETFISSRYDLFLKDLETIVNIDSSSENTDGILEIALFFENRFKALGLETEIEKSGENKVPCLIAESKGNKEVFDVMFLGHMDTVFPKGEAKKRPFSTDGKKAFGPGVCDMKGGLLVVLHTLEALAHQGLLEKLSVCVVFNGDEEVGSNTSKDLIRTMGKKSERVFVFEPCRPDYRFVLRRKGGGWFFVTAKGRSSHAGADPEKGNNAVLEIARQVIAINALNSREMGTSAQVTMISGGDAVNIIPDRASAAVDIRISSLSEKQRVEEFFRSLPENSHDTGVCLSVEGSVDRPPMEPNDKTWDLWNLVKKTAGQLDVQADYISTGGCSDGNFTSSLGVPTIDGMGLVGANSHSPDEFVELDSISKMTLIVAEICSALIGEISSHL